MRKQSTQNSGFSLVELFIVVLVIVAMAAFALSHPTSALRGSRLSQAEQILTEQIKVARQQAVTRNHHVEVRFMRYGDPEVPGESVSDPASGSYRAIQLLEVLDNGAVVPLDKPQSLPEGIVMSPGERSSLLSHEDLQPPRRASNSVRGDGMGGDPSLPRGIDWNYEFVSFRFLPDGGTDLSSTNGVTWCATLQSFNEQPRDPKLPANFVTLQIDPAAGSVRLFRPSAQ